MESPNSAAQAIVASILPEKKEPESEFDPADTAVDELMSALEAKDKRGVREALRNFASITREG